MMNENVQQEEIGECDPYGNTYEVEPISLTTVDEAVKTRGLEMRQDLATYIRNYF